MSEKDKLLLRLAEEYHIDHHGWKWQEKSQFRFKDCKEQPCIAVKEVLR